MLKRRLKEPFGKAGLTVAILALVLAMVGGAYAAGKLNGTQKKEVEKIAKKYAGKPGAAGATGPAGSNGSNGTAGKNGTPGKDGTNGKEGSPWTAGGTLPAKSTETGSWASSGRFKLGDPVFIPISFPIPLAEPLEEEDVHFIAEGDPLPTGCEGSNANPGAKPGNLCVFQGIDGKLIGLGGMDFPIINKAAEPGNQGAGETGAYISGPAAFASPPTEPTIVLAGGTWAVTAAE